GARSPKGSLPEPLEGRSGAAVAQASSIGVWVVWDVGHDPAVSPGPRHSGGMSVLVMPESVRAWPGRGWGRGSGSGRWRPVLGVARGGLISAMATAPTAPATTSFAAGAPLSGEERPRRAQVPDHRH